MAITALRMAPVNSSRVMLAGSSKNFSIRLSSNSATASTSFSRYSSTISTRSAGMSMILYVIPWVSSSHTMAFLSSKSTIPRNSASAPMGTWRGTALPRSFSSIWRTTLKKSAPVRSILFTKAIRGTLYLVAWRHTVSVCGCTPPTAHNSATAPSRTRKERSTSTVKSTCPGVSIMLILYSSVWPAISSP